jgi:glucose/arabinose dehydrogenase
VVEKNGAVRIIRDGKLLDKPFLDITDRLTSSGSEQGFLGLAFPPDYANRKFFFVDYTDTNGDTVVARFNVSADANVADPSSEFVVLKIDQPAQNHNGGNLVFGPDGYLWIGTGDGGGANDRFGNGQNPNTLLAKMLRIDVTSDPTMPYVIPQDNPSSALQWKVLPEVWAIGLRNPWRYSFDRANGDLWIGDVGQNQIEEVDVVRAGSKGGLNFGWPIMEGFSCFQAASCDQSGLVLPVASYQHGADGCSITGGYVYRGSQFPALQGVYFYGDYCSGRIWGLDAAKPGQPRLLLEVGAGLSSFGEDQAGELYITDLARGTVRHVVVP